MQAKSLKDTFKEILFLLPDKPEDKVQLFVLLIHSINVKDGLINTGLRENDQEKEYVGIAEGWQKAVDKVYSLRYKNSDDDVIQFKFVCDLVQADKVQVNVIKVQDRTQMHTLDVNLSEIDYTNEESIMLTNYIPQYKKAILEKILPKQRFSLSQQIDYEDLQDMQIPKIQNIFGDFGQRSNYGQRDIDPFYQNSAFNRQDHGGMLFGPQQFRPNNNPNHHPRGARFDPYGPDPSINPFGNERRFGPY
ncbi:hypothetical protein pb186bvf_005934 [Paramecium bursaria]